MSNSSGVSSMNLVWQLARHERSGWARMLVTKGMLVLTPRTRTSLMARAALRQTAGKVLIPTGDLHQQRVVVGGDDGAHVGVAAVQPDAEAAGGASRP